jgi:carboxyl-terminal processing protease
VINAFTPYLHSNSALIGTNTYGKPVGQIALDKPACDDRLRVVAFTTQNAARNGNYFDGLASTVEATCRATDDISFPLGDPREASTRRALDFLAGRSCSAITGDVGAPSARTTASTRQDLLIPAAPSAAQRMVPGSF